MAAGGDGLTGIVVRVDDRLIHGQILFGWAVRWPADEVWLGSDTVSENIAERELYTNEIAKYCEGGVLPVSSLISRFSGFIGQDRRILLVVASCKDAAEIVDNGVPIKEIQIGNLSDSPDRTIEAGRLKLSPSEIELLESLANNSVAVVDREFPASIPISLLDSIAGR